MEIKKLILFLSLFGLFKTSRAQNEHPFIRDTTSVSHNVHKFEITLENPLITGIKSAASYVMLFRDSSSEITSTVGSVGAVEFTEKNSLFSFYLDMGPKKSPISPSFDISTDRLHPERYTWYNQVGGKAYLSDFKFVESVFFLLTVGEYYSIVGDEYNVRKFETDIFWQTNRFKLDSQKNLSVFCEGYTKYRTPKDNYLQIELGLRYIHWKKITLIIMAKCLNGNFQEYLFFGFRYAPTVN